MARLSPSQHAQVADLFLRGYSYDEIGALLGCSRNVVSGILTRRGITASMRSPEAQYRAATRNREQFENGAREDWVARRQGVEHGEGSTS